MRDRGPEKRRSSRDGIAVLLGLQSLLLAMVGGLCLLSAYHLQSSLDRRYISQHLGTELQTSLSRPDDLESLRTAMGKLIDPGNTAGLALRSLVLFDADGMLLASVGRFSHWRLQGNIGHRIEAALNSLTGASGQQLIKNPAGRVLGSVQYSFDVAEIAAVREVATRRLRWAGWSALVLVALTAPIWWWLLRSRRRTDQSWQRRADPHAAPASEMIDAATASMQFRDRAGLVLDALGYGMATTDREGRIRFINATAERMSGWPLSAAEGRMVYSVFHLVDADGNALPNPVETTLRNAADIPPQSGWLRARDGGRTPVEISCCMVRNRDRLVDGTVMLCRDTARELDALDTQRRSAQLSQAVVDHLEEGVLMTDPAGVVRFANARAERMFGYARDELQGFTISKLMPVPFLNTPGIRLSDYIAGSVRETPLPKIVGWRRDATTFPVELWVQPLQVEQSAGLVVIVRDISDRLRGDKLAGRLGRLLDAAVEEVYIFDAQSLLLLEVNRGARRNLGYRTEVLQRMTPLDISRELDPQMFRSYLVQLRGGEHDHLVYRCRHARADGSTYPVEVRLNFSRDEEPPVFMAIAVDISEQLANEAQLQQLAHHDALTGLPNRLVLQDRLQQAWLAANRGARMLGVLFLDLDRFKQINDQHGHEVGDLVLREVADRLRSTMRNSDTVARLAGDEFVILAPGLRSIDDAEQLAQKLLDRFAEPAQLGGITLTIRPSIGVTLYPLDDADPEGLLRHADAAMYEAKKAGRGCYRVFSTEVDADRRRRLDLEREIHAAIALNQLHMRLAPVMDMTRGTVLAVIASLYWQHPRLGRIEHAELMRVAARTNLVGTLELLQIARVCQHHLAGGRHAIPQLPFIVEISGWELRSNDFFTQLTELLDRERIDGDRLILAVGADALPEPQQLASGLDALLARGLRFALRGFSLPLPAPERLPIALLMADADADEDAIQAARAAAIERLLPLVAVHVDHVLQKNRWSAAGCHWLSGAVVQPAMDAQQALSWFEGRKIDEL